MAIDEISVENAIRHFQYCISHGVYKEPVLSYARMAVKALRAHQDAENNGPLTVRDLLDNIDEPIYVRFLDDGFVSPAILDAKPGGTVVAIWGCLPGNILLLDDYGKTWIAYRYRPKEVQK